MFLLLLSRTYFTREVVVGQTQQTSSLTEAPVFNNSKATEFALILFHAMCESGGRMVYCMIFHKKAQTADLKIECDQAGKKVHV